MKYFPAFCDSCTRSFLSVVEAATESIAHPLCPRCRSQSRLIPSAYYTAPAHQAFEDLERTLSRARLSTPQAQLLVSLLERALREQEQLSRETVAQALSKFPGLSALESVLPEHAPGLARSLGMLLTLLTPLATSTGNGSGLRPAVEQGPAFTAADANKTGQVR